MFGFLRDASTAPAPSGPHQSEIVGLLLTYPSPSVDDLMSFLKLYTGDERTQVAQELIANGVASNNVSSALASLATQSKFKGSWIWGVLSIASGALSGYHGYRRNKSIGWGITWFALGTIFPVITPTIALAEGFAKPKAS